VAKSKLTAGGDIDTLTEAELRAALGPFFRLLSKSEEVNIFGTDQTLTANAAGVLVSNNNEAAIYRCPNTHYASIHRYEITSPGFTSAAPLSGAGLTFGLWTNDPSVPANQFYGLPTAAGGFIAPVFYSEGSLSAKTLRPGEQIYAAGSGFVAATIITVRLQLRLAPLTESMKNGRK
jgi:hypothetical protein